MTTTPVAHASHLAGGRLASMIFLSVLAAGLFVFRGTAIWQDLTLAPGDRMREVGLAALAALLVIGAATTASRAMWWTAGTLGAALVIELSLSRSTATPPFILVPLTAALAVLLTPLPPHEQAGADHEQAKTGHGQAPSSLAAASLILMVPLGLVYAASMLLFPEDAALGLALTYSTLLAATIWWAGRGRWWVLAGPVLAATTLFALGWVGERFLGWTA